MKRGALAVAVTLGALALPAAASAGTLCVQKPGCDPADTFDSLQLAINDAAGRSGRGRIEIGPVALPAGEPTVLASNQVDIVGGGVGETTLTGSGDAALTVADAASTVSD